MQHDETTVLIADIGGTNCRFELWTVDGEASNHKQILKHVGIPDLARRNAVSFKPVAHR